MASKEQKKQLADLIAEWTKKSDALIAVPLFKDGELDRGKHQSLRDEEAAARLQVDHFLYDLSESF